MRIELEAEGRLVVAHPVQLQLHSPDWDLGLVRLLVQHLPADANFAPEAGVHLLVCLPALQSDRRPPRPASRVGQLWAAEAPVGNGKAEALAEASHHFS